MLNIFPDESLQSYVLRVIISHGLTSRAADTIGIISSLGEVKYELALTEQQCWIFSAFPVKTLMSLLENHMPMLGFPKFSHPKSLAVRCGKIFFHKRTDAIEEYIKNFQINTNVTYSLCYCPECIREQIQEHGSGWFKLKWLTRKSCDIHNFDLVSVMHQACSCKLKICDKVVSALSGICVSCKSETKPPEKKSYCELPHTPSLAEKMYKENKVSVSPCLVRDFEKWVRELYQRLNDDVNLSKSFEPFVLDELRVLRREHNYARPDAERYILHVLQLFDVNANDHFCDFLDKRTEILEIDCSDCVPSQIFADYRVAKNRDCATCWVNSGECPLKT